LNPIQRNTSLNVLFRTGENRSFRLAVDGDAERAFNLPQKLRLYANYPNPFNPSTRLEFDIPKRGKVFLTIYDVVGRKVRVVIAGQTFEPGSHATEWDGLSDSGALAGSGVYFARLRAAGDAQVQKITLIR
jgi:hypothetical protein